MEAPSKANEIDTKIQGEPILEYNINMTLMDEDVCIQISIFISTFFLKG